MTDQTNDQTNDQPHDQPDDQPQRITQVAHDGLVFDVLDSGPLDGEVVVLLHGFPERATSWRYVSPVLEQAGLRTLALDQRGYAPGARPPRRRDYRLPLLVADVVALIDAAVGPDGAVHLVGHDWGAVAAWVTAVEHPERLRSLTAVSVPHPQAFLTAGVRSTQLLRSWYMALFQLPLLPEVMGRRGVMDRVLRTTGMTEEDLARFRAEIVDDGALGTALNWYRALPLTDPRASDARVTVPTTMVWSDGDTAIARWGAEHTVRWVDADYEFVELAGVSHWIPTQAPDALAQAILQRVRG